MTDETDPIGAALKTAAEAARDRIRAEGLICPSCGQDYADLLGRHNLVLIMAGDPGPGAIVEAECRDGQRIRCATWGDIQAAANISLADEVWRQETIAFDRDVTGTGRGEFTGLLSVLEGEGG